VAGQPNCRSQTALWSATLSLSTFARDPKAHLFGYPWERAWGLFMTRSTNTNPLIIIIIILTLCLNDHTWSSCYRRCNCFVRQCGGIICNIQQIQIISNQIIYWQNIHSTITVFISEISTQTLTDGFLLNSVILFIYKCKKLSFYNNV